jgi:hypothetical protein
MSEEAGATSTAGLLAALLALSLILGGCAGTQLAFSGNVCNMPIELQLVDRKDRSGFTAHVECPGGGAMDIASTDSSTSAVINALSSQIQALSQMVVSLAGKAALGAASYTVPTPPGELIMDAISDGRLP